MTNVRGGRSGLGHIGARRKPKPPPACPSSVNAVGTSTHYMRNKQWTPRDSFWALSLVSALRSKAACGRVVPALSVLSPHRLRIARWARVAYACAYASQSHSPYT